MYRTKTYKCDISNSPVMYLKKLGYLVNLRQIERELNLKPQIFKPCFKTGYCTNVCINLAKIEDFIKEKLIITKNHIQALKNLGAILNITELARQTNIKPQYIKSCLETGKCKAIEPQLNELEAFIEKTFKDL